MAKQYRRKVKFSKFKNLSMQWYGLVFFASVAVFFIIFQEVNKEQGLDIKRKILDFSAPVLEFFSHSTQNIGDAVQTGQDMLSAFEENQRLREENAELRAANAELADLTAENKVFRRLLNLSEDYIAEYITARVISDTSGPFYRTLLLNAGSGEGVEEDMPVMAEQGLVGRVIAVGKNYSRVLLLDDWSSRIPVVIEGTGVQAIVAGRNGQPPQLIHLIGDFTVPPRQDMRILTSGRGGIFPSGFAIGRLQISESRSQDTGSTSHYSIIPYADSDNQTFLRIYTTVQPSDVTPQ